jgi:hypothetical protein
MVMGGLVRTSIKSNNGTRCSVDIAADVATDVGVNAVANVPANAPDP